MTRTRRGPHLEANDDGIRRRRQHDVALGDPPNTTVDDVQCNLLGRQLQERVGKCLNGATNVGSSDEVELAEVANCQTASSLVVRNVLLPTQRLSALDLLAALRHASRPFLLVEYNELIADCCGAHKSKNHRRPRSPDRLDSIVAFINHGADAAAMDTRHEDIANAECTGLDEHRGHVTASFLEATFDDETVRVTVRVSRQFFQLSLEQHFVEEVINALAGVRRYE